MSEREEEMMIALPGIEATNVRLLFRGDTAGPRGFFDLMIPDWGLIFREMALKQKRVRENDSEYIEYVEFPSIALRNPARGFYYDRPVRWLTPAAKAAFQDAARHAFDARLAQMIKELAEAKGISPTQAERELIKREEPR
jgi:hypothetical protein